MEVGTVLAIVSLVGGVVASVEKCISVFDSIQNVPKELGDFRTSVARLQRHITAFEAAGLSSEGPPVLLEDDRLQIRETLILCRDLFNEHEAAVQRQGILSGALRANLTLQSIKLLTRYKARIDSHYQQILIPGWLEVVSKRLSVDTEAISTADRTVSRPTVTVSPVVARAEIELLSKAVEKLKGTDRREITETTLYDLEDTLQRCWQQLGLPVSDVLDIAGLTDRRRISIVQVIPYQAARTTLVLDNAKEQHRELKLEEVHIMARDDQSRILQYRNANKTIHVTHIIPYGSIPWTSDVDSKRVSFLTQHVITICNEGYHSYNLDPKYKFDEIETCEKFQSILRERDLVKAFLAVEIRQAGTCTSKRQVIRFWRKSNEGKGTIITMTYLESSINTGRSHKELDFRDFRQDPMFVIPENVLRDKIFKRRRPEESVFLDVISVTNIDERSLRIKFETKDDARSFKELFKDVHPLNTPAPRLELRKFTRTSLYPESSLASSPLGTPSDSMWSDEPPPSLASALTIDTEYEDQ